MKHKKKNKCELLANIIIIWFFVFIGGLVGFYNGGWIGLVFGTLISSGLLVTLLYFLENKKEERLKEKIIGWVMLILTLAYFMIVVLLYWVFGWMRG